MKLIAYRVSFDDGVVETFEVRARNISTGYFKALHFACKAAGKRQIARIECVELTGMSAVREP